MSNNPMIDENALYEINEPYKEDMYNNESFTNMNPYQIESSMYTNPMNFNQPNMMNNEMNFNPNENENNFEMKKNEDSTEEEEIDENEAKKYYVEDRPLHGLPHPLDLLIERRPGIDQRQKLVKPDGKLFVYSNVLFLTNVSDRFTDKFFAEITKPICDSKKIIPVDKKNQMFITAYTRRDAMKLYHFLYNLDTGNEQRFSISWGKEFWMKKDEYDDKIGRVNVPPETIPSDIMINFDNTYVYCSDIERIYGVQMPVNHHDNMPSIMDRNYHQYHQNMNNQQYPNMNVPPRQPDILSPPRNPRNNDGYRPRPF